MTSPASSYVNSVHQRLGYLGCWLPNANVALGDVGVLEQDVFRLYTTLRALELPFKIRKGTKPIDFAFSSESGVEIKVKAKGEIRPGVTLPKASAGVSLQFSQAGGFVFQAAECFVDEIEDRAALGRAILALHRESNDKWKKEWCVVDTLVRAGSATIVVSNSANAVLDLTSSATVDPSNLAKVDTAIKVSHQSGDLFHAVAQLGLAPLFKLARLKRRWLGMRFAGRKDETSEVRDESKLFDRITPEGMDHQ